MKTCQMCGYVDFHPEKCCPKCAKKYSDSCWNCNPLDSATKTANYGDIDTIPSMGVANGYATTGDPNAKHNKD